MLNWRIAGQAYGILSKFAFIVLAEGEEEFNNFELEAFEVASSGLEKGIIHRAAFNILIDSIKDYSGSNYWLDDDDLYYESDEDDEDEYEDDYEDDEDDYEDYHSCGCCDDSDDEDCFCNDTDKIAVEDILKALDKIKDITINFKSEDK